MFKFPHLDVAELLGFTPICQVSDEEIWHSLVTPITKGLLGPIVGWSQPHLRETIDGLFQGDEVSNLNDHRLYGGQKGFVRFPYAYSFYKTQNGAFIVKRDGVKFEALCYYGDVEKGKGELILKAALRDRRYDGTRRANDSALLSYAYDDPELSKRLHPDLKSVELSIYGYMPGSRVVDVTGEPEFDAFVTNPFTFLDRPELFMQYFKRAWNSKRAPLQSSAPVADVSRLALPAAERIAKARGYDVVEMAVSHFHVAKWAQSHSYVYSYAVQAQTIAQFEEGLAKIRANGQPLTRSQQSWVCVIQSLRPTELIPDGLYLDGPIWPQDNLSQACLWVHKPLTDKARELLKR